MIPLNRFGTLRTLELFEVARGTKHAARFVVHIDEVAEHYEAAHSLGLIARRAPYTLSISGPEKDYLVRAPGAYTIIAVARDDPAYVLALEENHRALGALLGYPACCIDHFVVSEVQGNQVRDHGTSHAEHFALAATPHRVAPFWMNTLKRDEHVLLSHLPCSLDCEHSHHIGRKRARLLRSIDPYWFEEVRSLLSGTHHYLSQQFTFTGQEP